MDPLDLSTVQAAINPEVIDRHHTPVPGASLVRDDPIVQNMGLLNSKKGKGKKRARADETSDSSDSNSTISMDELIVGVVTEDEGPPPKQTRTALPKEKEDVIGSNKNSRNDLPATKQPQMTFNIDEDDDQIHAEPPAKRASPDLTIHPATWSKVFTLGPFSPVTPSTAFPNPFVDPESDGTQRFKSVSAGGSVSQPLDHIRAADTTPKRAPEATAAILPHADSRNNDIWGNILDRKAHHHGASSKITQTATSGTLAPTPPFPDATHSSKMEVDDLFGDIPASFGDSLAGRALSGDTVPNQGLRAFVPIQRPTQHVTAPASPLFDPDRLFALQMLEEERQNAMDSEVARYLSEATGPVNDEISFDYMVAQGLVSAETQEYLKNLDAMFDVEMSNQDEVFPEPIDSDDNIKILDSRTVLPKPASQDVTTLDKAKGKETATDTIAAAQGSSTQFTGSQSVQPIGAFFVLPSADKITIAPRPIKSDPVTSKCGICFDLFRPANYPRIASEGRPRGSASHQAAAELPFGIVLECPDMHGYCVTCVAEYVNVKLMDGTTFPVRCPDCPRDGMFEITDETAERILNETEMEKWWTKRVMGSLSNDMFYCINPTCSYPLEPPEEEDVTIAECPMCHISMCFQCKTNWHPDVTCEEREELKKASPEDRELFEMAKKEQWRRCPKCRMIVGKSEGCHHMTCRCTFEFCWLCGDRWGAGGCGGACGGWKDDGSLILGAQQAAASTSGVALATPR